MGSGELVGPAAWPGARALLLLLSASESFSRAPQGCMKHPCQLLWVALSVWFLSFSRTHTHTRPMLILPLSMPSSLPPMLYGIVYSTMLRLDASLHPFPASQPIPAPTVLFELM